MRLHELAKEIGVSSKELLALSREIGLNVKSHSSNLAAGEESILRIAIKQELEERAAEEAEKNAAAEAEKAEQQAQDAPESQEETPAESEAEPVAAEGETATAVAASSEAEAEGATVAPPGPGEAEAEVAEGEEAAAEPAETEAVTVQAETAEEGTEEKVEEEKPKPKIKKMPPRRPGATILGRIDLKSSMEEAQKKAREREARTREAGGKIPGRDDTEPLVVPESVGFRGPGRPLTPEEEKEQESKKIKKFIKPKQQPVVFDPDDELLQGIRIRHWNKHARPRRSSYRPGSKPRRKMRRTEPLVHKKVAVVPPISVKDLSQLLGIKVQQLLFSLLNKGTVANINSALDEEAVLQIAVDFDREIDIVEEQDLERDFLEEQEAFSVEEDDLEVRAPIVTLLGHVDHGKTSLLDAIRKTNVAASEDGGITQHVSAYKVLTGSGQSVVFLDTPGHRAFTEMRARGANVTDIVVLVVAADDGVMPQTEEAIQHAQAAEVPIVVAVNKSDKPTANAMRVKQQLAGLGVMTEDWGGEVGCVEVSATTGQGLEQLLERLVLEAEIQELRCNPNQHAQGVVIEARKDDEIGNVVTLLQTDGTLRLRDTLLAGECICKVRAMFSDQGKAADTVGPSSPVNVIGFESLPEAGEKFLMVEDVSKAREIADLRHERQVAERAGGGGGHYDITLENLFESIEAGKVKEIKIVLKADVKGTLEVLRRSLGELVHEEVKVKVLRDGLGAITEDDILLAAASEAVVIGFHVSPEEKAKKLSDEHGVEVRTYRVIYQLIDDLRAAMEGTLEPIKKEKNTAHLEIREIFKSSRLGHIAGCMVTDGTIHRSDKIRVIRDGEVVFDGELASLKRFKEDHREVKEGFECGVKIAGFDDIRDGDVLESYEIVEEKRSLELES